MFVASYYFPNYHADRRNTAFHGQEWTEWQLVKEAKPRFAGHQQPKVPQWGYEDEADPAVMARKIAAAADHGIDAFIFDWYYYDDGPFLERGLKEGFLHATNNARLKFALMWANHNWLDIHPARQGQEPRLLYPGMVKPATFDRICNYVIEKYFRHPSYWKIDGRPYFSIYELFRLIEGFDGSIDRTATALARFREKVRDAGFPDLHLNAVVWGIQLLPGETAIKNPAELISRLGFDSVTSYVWVHHYVLPDFPVTAYDAAMNANQDFWRQADRQYPVPYYPNVTMGWDASPRTLQTDEFVNTGYPFMPVLTSTPEQFQAALAKALTHLESKPEKDRILTINAWNEWTEGSYLEPDLDHGDAYLKAIRDTISVPSSVNR